MQGRIEDVGVEGAGVEQQDVGDGPAHQPAQGVVCPSQLGHGRVEEHLVERGVGRVVRRTTAGPRLRATPPSTWGE